MTSRDERANAPVRRFRLGEIDEEVETIRYWLTRTPEERISAVEDLRRAYYGEDYEKTLRLTRDPSEIRIVRRGEDAETNT